MFNKKMIETEEKQIVKILANFMENLIINSGSQLVIIQF